MPFPVRAAVAGCVLAVLVLPGATGAEAQSHVPEAAAVAAPAVSGHATPASAPADPTPVNATPVDAAPFDTPAKERPAAGEGPGPEGARTASEASPAAAVPPAPEAPSLGAPPGSEAAPAIFSLDVAGALDRLGPRAQQVDKRDRAGLIAVYAARRGEPIWVGRKGATADAVKLAAEIRNGDAWGLRASAFDVPRIEKASFHNDDADLSVLADTEVRLSLAVLKYARHARGGRVEPTALTKFLDRKSQAYDPASVLAQIATAVDPGEYLRALHPRHPQFASLRQKYLAARKGAVVETAAPAAADDRPGAAGKAGRSAPKAADEPASARRLLANMEQWRWMPDDLGSFHVWVNVPEYLVRVVRDGRVIHTERVVVGKLDTQTPIFSDAMEQVIFHPFWGVPDSIKLGEVLPSLRGSGAVLAKHNLRIQSGGRDIDPKSVDWTKTDIRRFHVYQPPGADNVLGVVKFRFPNKHDVYMHDTPSKSLFKAAVRTFSHGCMRVQDPVRLAELLLAEDRRMPPDKVRSLTRSEAPQNNAINLTRPIPVHVTYFTASVDAAGKVSTFRDVYGHEERVLLGLDGKMSQIKPVPEPKPGQHAEPVGALAEIKATETNWSRAVFSAGN